MMDWWLPLIYIFGGLVLLLGIGVPVALPFSSSTCLAPISSWENSWASDNCPLYVRLAGLLYDVPVVLFILMGESSSMRISPRMPWTYSISGWAVSPGGSGWSRWQEGSCSRFSAARRSRAARRSGRCSFRK